MWCFEKTGVLRFALSRPFVNALSRIHTQITTAGRDRQKYKKKTRMTTQGLMYISNDDTQNYPFLQNEWLKRLNIQPNKTTNQNSLKSPKLLSQRISNVIIKLFGLV